MTRSLIIFGIACFASCCFGFHFNDCTNSTNRLMRVTHINISSDPIHIPSDETIFAAIEVYRPIDTNHFHMNLVVQKLLGSHFLKIPCLGMTGDTGNVGSCSYDVCTELNNRWIARHCPITGIDSHLTNYNCSCPVQPGTYHINSKTIHIPMLSSLLTPFAVGDYKARAEVTDNNNSDEVVFCFEATVTTTTDSDCTGLQCIFG